MPWLPTSAQLTLYKAGRSIATTIGQRWDIPLTEPGVYRLEAFRHDKPWIFSNPIYVRPAEILQPPATDLQPSVSNPEPPPVSPAPDAP